tara:strand:+ start:557 stop:1021 length:465 start_codon:yes stop_codon:yes gene_type:complete
VNKTQGCKNIYKGGFPPCSEPYVNGNFIPVINEQLFKMQCKRICIVAFLFLGLNLVALSVNSFEISPRFLTSSAEGQYEVYLFTDAGKKKNVETKIIAEGPQDGFWPFVQFYKTCPSKPEKKGCFRGLFADFGVAEFLFYSMMIGLVSIFIRLW